MNQNARHLRLLSIFHYIVGAMSLGFCLIPGVFIVVGGLASFHRLETSPEPPPPWLGWFILAIGLGLLLSYLVLAICLLLTGRFLARHQHHTFCMVGGALACILMPFGTVLGVFTIVVLSRPSVRDLFSKSTGAGTSPSLGYVHDGI